MPKIILNYQKCISCGLCASFCPEFFQWDDKGSVVLLKGAKKDKKKAEIQVNALLCAKEVVDACPAIAIKLED